MRATLELDLVKRPWNKAQAIFIGVMTPSGFLGGFGAPRVGGGAAWQLCDTDAGTTWELDREKFQNIAPRGC